MNWTWYFPIAAAVIIVIYMTTPESALHSVAVEEQSNVNWTGFNAVGYGGNVVGSFNGWIDKRDINSLSNMSGDFVGSIFWMGNMRDAKLNVSSGDFSGVYEGSMVAENRINAKNMSGYAGNWRVQGVYNPQAVGESEPAKGIDYMTIIYVIGFLGVIYLISKWKLGGGQKGIDDGKIDRKLRKWLKEEYSLVMWYASKHVSFPKQNPEMRVVVFQLDAPCRGEWCIATYETNKGYFYDFSRHVNQAEINAEIERRTVFVDEQRRGKWDKTEKELQKQGTKPPAP